MFISSTCIQTHCEGFIIFILQSSATIMSKNHLQSCSKNINPWTLLSGNYFWTSWATRTLLANPPHPTKVGLRGTIPTIQMYIRENALTACQNSVFAPMPKFCAGCQENRKQRWNKDKQSLEAFSISPWEACTHGIWWVGNMQVTGKLMKIGSTDFHLSHRPFSTREIFAGSLHSPPPPFARFLRELGASVACLWSKSARTSHHTPWPPSVGPCWTRHRCGGASFREIEGLWKSRWSGGPNNPPPKALSRRTSRRGFPSLGLRHRPGDTGQGSETQTHHISMLPISRKT